MSNFDSEINRGQNGISDSKRTRQRRVAKSVFYLLFYRESTIFVHITAHNFSFRLQFKNGVIQYGRVLLADISLSNANIMRYRKTNDFNLFWFITMFIIHVLFLNEFVLFCRVWCVIVYVTISPDVEYCRVELTMMMQFFLSLSRNDYMYSRTDGLL